MSIDSCYLCDVICDARDVHSNISLIRIKLNSREHEEELSECKKIYDVNVNFQRHKAMKISEKREAIPVTDRECT
jgi:hypothetical protein